MANMFALIPVIATTGDGRFMVPGQVHFCTETS